MSFIPVLVLAASMAEPASTDLGAAAPALGAPVVGRQEAGQPAGGVAEEAAPNDRSAQNNPIENEMTPALDRAVARGLARLAAMQAQDGSWGQQGFGRGVAVTSLACIALMADGNLPGRGAYGEQVSKGLEFVLRSSTESGLLATDATNSPMYGHGFATLFLGEVYGMTQGGGDTQTSDRVHRALVRAVRLIESTQNSEGGWRYNPVPFDADTSVTIAQIMALRSARNAGLEVSKQVVDRAVEYVRSCQNPDGGFRYQASPGPTAWPRSAASVASLQYAGIYEDRAIDSGLAYLFTQAFPGRGEQEAIHYYYGQYYAIQAVFLAGGDHWARWWPAARQELLSRQRDDGSWEDSSAGDEYATAMALIVLQMPKRYLPIFQK
ncbi:MAG TPA: prenyltransferase/squalene oxidase repeat-containing protein [Phycisphaerales bacterium]|nr:prenyltransferase/squalene oxidase repeat-containing protein [Phycisphaerales bacterium]